MLRLIFLGIYIDSILICYQIKNETLACNNLCFTLSRVFNPALFLNSAICGESDLSQNYDDLSLLSVRSAFDHLQSTINRALERIERQSLLSHNDVFSAIKERRKLAKVLRLDQRLIHLYRELSSRASLKITQDESLIHCEITSSIVVQEGDEKSIQFKLNDNVYTLKFEDRAGACIAYYGETFKSSNLSLLLSSSQEVLSLHLDLKGESEVITEQQITAFVPGKWIYDIIHAYETLVTAENLKSIGYAYSDEKLEALKQKFGI
tara:strand:+ start:221 stop:1012 length:792 start_codon:yes stop_codon:yes gene_type:complete